MVARELMGCCLCLVCVGHGLEGWVSGRVHLSEQAARGVLVPGVQVLLKTCMWQNTMCSVLLVSRLRSERRCS